MNLENLFNALRSLLQAHIGASSSSTIPIQAGPSRTPQNQQMTSANFSLFGNPIPQVQAAGGYPAIIPPAPGGPPYTPFSTYSYGYHPDRSPGKYINPGGAPSPVGGIDYYAGVHNYTPSGGGNFGATTYPFVNAQGQPVYFDSTGNQFLQKNGQFVPNPNPLTESYGPIPASSFGGGQ